MPKEKESEDKKAGLSTFLFRSALKLEVRKPETDSRHKGHSQPHFPHRTTE